MQKFDDTGKVEEEFLGKTESGVPLPGIVRTFEEYRYEPENAQLKTGQVEEAIQMDLITALWVRKDSAFFPKGKESLGNHPSEFIQSFYSPITRDVMFYPVESLFQRTTTENWSANESDSHLIGALWSFLEWKDRNMITHEVEEGSLSLEQLKNLCEQSYLIYEWPAREPDLPILIYHHGKKIRYIRNHGLDIPTILSKDIDDGKSYLSVKLSHPNPVNPFAYCWKDKRLLGLGVYYWFIRKENLENSLFKKYPIIGPVSLDKPIKIHTGAGGWLIALHSHQTFMASNTLLDPTTKSLPAQTPIYVGARDFTALDIPSVLLQCGKKDMVLKKTLPRAWAMRAKDVAEMAFQWWHQPSHLQKSQTIKANHQSKSNSHHLLLLIATLLATITLHAALRTSGCRLGEEYNDNSRLNSIFKIETCSNRLFIMFNSLAFSLSVAFILRFFNELPLGPLLLISVFSMIGAYMCIMMDPGKLCTSPS